MIAGGQWPLEESPGSIGHDAG